MGVTRTLARATTAPMRIGLSAGELALEVALGVVRGTRRAIERDGRRVPAPQRPPRPPEPRPRPPVRAAPERGEPRPPTAQPQPEAAPPRPQPPPPRPEAARPPVSPADAAGPAIPARPTPAGAKEVDDTAVPAGEFGERGAEEDAGAEVTVGPPWEGYDELTAADIQRRLADADRETVAAVALYEGSHRDRRSVIRATERRLRALAL